MTITLHDRVSALVIACAAERDAVVRAERAGNGVAAAINRQRVEAAEARLEAAKLAMFCQH